MCGKKFPIICILFLIFSNLTFAQGDTCGDDLAPRLTIGSMGVVLPGSPNNVRASAETRAALLDAIDGGESFTVLEGPVCNAGFMWWRVESQDGEGWTVSANLADGEYYVMPIDHQLVRFGEVIFDLPPKVAESAEGSIVEADYSSTNPANLFAPQYTLFTFDGYADEHFAERDRPEIRIYRADAFDDVTSMLGDAIPPAIEELALTLEEEPDLYETFAAAGSDQIPDDTVGAAQGILAHLSYLDFENGRGIRFVTFYTQSAFVPDNDELLYRFFGLTTDGEYLVSATMPIDAPELLETPADLPDSEFFGFMRQFETFLDDLAPQTFMPDLTELDALVASLYVGDQ